MQNKQECLLLFCGYVYSTVVTYADQVSKGNEVPFKITGVYWRVE
jgi:hypothetical protein